MTAPTRLEARRDLTSTQHATRNTLGKGIKTHAVSHNALHKCAISIGTVCTTQQTHTYHNTFPLETKHTSGTNTPPPRYWSYTHNAPCNNERGILYIRHAYRIRFKTNITHSWDGWMYLRADSSRTRRAHTQRKRWIWTSRLDLPTGATLGICTHSPRCGEIGLGLRVIPR